MTSYWYLTILLLLCLYPVFFLALSYRTGTIDSWHVVIMLTILVVFGYELWREHGILLTAVVPDITYERIVLLRWEHTFMGLSLGEVVHYVRTRHKRWSTAIRQRFKDN